MTDQELASAPLVDTYARAGVSLLLDARHSCDTLLIAADAFSDLARSLAAIGAAAAASESHLLADRLRTEAPNRGPYHVGLIASHDEQPAQPDKDPT